MGDSTGAAVVKSVGSQFIKGLLIVIFLQLSVIIFFAFLLKVEIDVWGLKIHFCRSDTIRIEKLIPVDTAAILKNHGYSPATQKSSGPSKPTISQNNTNGKGEVNINNGTNNGNIGGTHNYGIVPRKVSDEFVRNFLIKYPDRNMQITFQSVGEPDGEMIDYKNSIISALKAHKYWRIDQAFYFSFRTGVTEYPEEAIVELESQGPAYNIVITPNSKKN